MCLMVIDAKSACQIRYDTIAAENYLYLHPMQYFRGLAHSPFHSVIQANNIYPCTNSRNRNEITEICHNSRLPLANDIPKYIQIFVSFDNSAAKNHKNHIWMRVNAPFLIIHMFIHNKAAAVSAWNRKTATEYVRDGMDECIHVLGNNCITHNVCKKQKRNFTITCYRIIKPKHKK